MVMFPGCTMLMMFHLVVLVNKSGEIVYSHLGYMKGDEIEVEKIIIGLLKD